MDVSATPGLIVTSSEVTGRSVVVIGFVIGRTTKGLKVVSNGGASSSVGCFVVPPPEVGPGKTMEAKLVVSSEVIGEVVVASGVVVVTVDLVGGLSSSDDAATGMKVVGRTLGRVVS